MNSGRLGREIVALRHRRGLRQVDLAAIADIPRSAISLVENDGAGRLQLDQIDRIARALGARVDVCLWWHGERLDRLLDAAHAALVEEIVRRLAKAGWMCETEVTFEVRGERGSMDILAWHPARSVLLVVEVKSG